jgi:response regulator of citrate/malate metabolism
VTYTCAIIEDEFLSEKYLKSYIRKVPFLELSWKCSYAEEAVDIIKSQKVDLLFVDLQHLPIQPDDALVQLFNEHQSVIITSIYPKKFLNIELQVIAFIEKPFTFEVFQEALEIFVANKEQN